MAVWAALLIEFWKREQSRLQFEWDVAGFGEETEMVRPEFELKISMKRKNPITGVSAASLPN